MQKTLKIILALLITLLAAHFLSARFEIIKKSVAARDSIAYWAAARLLVHGSNPYDREAVLQLERQNDYQGDRPLILRTPPWSLILVLPLGFLSPLWAWVLWMAATLACLVTGMRLCRRLYGTGVPPNLLTLAGYVFAPVAACLISGQIGMVLMVGLILFLIWEPNRPFLAGVALVLPFAKPHLLLLVWVIAVTWALLNKKHQVVVGFVSALITASAISLLFDPHVFRHYAGMLGAASIQFEFIPALSGVLRLLFFRRFFWLQFVPMAAGLVWGLAFFIRLRSDWNWRVHMPPLLVVSLLTTPYAWFPDECLLLPAMIQATTFLYQARSGLKFFNRVGLTVLVLLNLMLLLILRAQIPFSTGIYFWSSLVWFFWYFHAHGLWSRVSRGKEGTS